MLFAYVSLVPYLLLGNLLLIAVVLSIAAIIRNHHIRIILAVLVTVPSVLYWTAYLTFTDVEERMAFDMEWSYGEKSPSYPNADHIVLHFKSHPNHFIGIYSRDLGNYLESLPTRDVRVVFEVTLDFGRTRGFHEVQIGDLHSWDSLDGYAGVSGNPESSPWP